MIFKSLTKRSGVEKKGPIFWKGTKDSLNDYKEVESGKKGRTV